MICYLCGAAIEDGAYFYSDHGMHVCKPCFAESPRCFVCRFPGKKLEEVAGLGSECECCRESLVREGDNLAEIVQPMFTYLAQFGHQAIPDPQFVWSNWNSLREMQSQVNQPPPEFIDDFLLVSVREFQLAAWQDQGLRGATLESAISQLKISLLPWVFAVLVCLRLILLGVGFALVISLINRRLPST